MDPERPIEKLLRQAAQARRTQAGELHPANRRVLQSEVARKFASARPEKRSFYELFMPRFAWAAALLVGLGLAASLMLPRQNASQTEMFFAKNDRVSAPRIMNESKPAAATRSDAPSEAPALASAQESARSASGATTAGIARAERDKDSAAVEGRRAETQRMQLALNEPAVASHGATSLGGSLASEKQKEELASRSISAKPPETPAPEGETVQRRYGLRVPAQPVPTSAPAGAAAVAPAEAKATDEMAKARLAYRSAPSSMASSSSVSQFNATTSADVAKRSPAPIARVSQQFVEASSLTKNVELADKSTVAKPILSSFQLQQLGREVRIIDSDGSVYSGIFQPAEVLSYVDLEARQKGEVTSALKAAAANRSLASPSDSTPERKGALDDSKLQADLSYAFQVTGTNRSLNQIVTFTGQVLTPTNALSLVGQAGGTLSGNRVAPPELNPLPLQTSRISGKALIGTNREVKIEAIPSH